MSLSGYKAAKVTSKRKNVWFCMRCHRVSICQYTEEKMASDATTLSLSHDHDHSYVNPYVTVQKLPKSLGSISSTIITHTIERDNTKHEMCS